MSDKFTPEFSRIVKTDEQVSAKEKLVIEANEKERAALAKRFELVSIDSLTAELTISTASNGEVTVRGPMNAKIVQNCVATLEPVPEVIEDTVEVLFSPHVSEEDLPSNPDDLEDLSEEELMALLDQPEPLVDGKIDVGEVVAQFLAVAMNPYPRKEDAELPTSVKTEEEAAEEKRPNPFAQLAGLKEQLEKKN
ncbi:YceD family protein [Thalassospira sp. CH_XMU1448-2]|uniref:YceD family protein n=1 Tax=Thalassospira sp. CH_XMU1448-2 TaxID=3107773 RepID=UPI00300B83C9